MECRGRGTPLPLHHLCRSLPAIRIRHFGSAAYTGWRDGLGERVRQLLYLLDARRTDQADEGYIERWFAIAVECDGARNLCLGSYSAS